MSERAQSTRAQRVRPGPKSPSSAATPLAIGTAVPLNVQNVLRAPGQSLPPTARTALEPRFGHDFGRVRIHHDNRAAESARSIGAAAYAYGQHVVLGPGQPTPGTPHGLPTLAHELAHVIQQERGGMPPSFGRQALEQGANSAMSAFTAGRTAIAVAGASAPGLVRQPAQRTGPRSLKGSLFALSDEDLDDEIFLIVDWLDANPEDTFERKHLVMELQRLQAVQLRRDEKARRGQKYLEDLARVVDAVSEGRIPKWMKVFPFRPTRGPFRMDVAPIFAWRKGGSIIVHQPRNAVANTDRFKKDADRLPSAVFSPSGFALSPNELVGVRLYDEDEKVAVCYAEDLLEFSDKSHNLMLLQIAVNAASVVVGPLIGKIVGKLVGKLVGRALSGLGKVSQRAIFTTKIALGRAQEGAVRAAPTALGEISMVAQSRAGTAVAQQTIAQTSVRAGVQSTVAQQAVTQSSVRAGVQTGVAQSTTQAARTAAPTVGTSIAPTVSTVAGIAGVETVGTIGAQATLPAAIPEAQEIVVSQGQYLAALGHTFPAHSFDFAYSLADSIGHQAARLAMQNPRFVAAVQAGNMTLAGTFFHSAAATIARNLPAASLPAGWILNAELTIQAGRGGSRADLLFTGPNGMRLEFDWKTSGRSALSTGSRREMQRHAGQITSNLGGTLGRQESRSWIDFVRTLWPGPWPR